MVVNNGILLICIRLFMIYLFFYGICSLGNYIINMLWNYFIVFFLCMSMYLVKKKLYEIFVFDLYIFLVVGNIIIGVYLIKFNCFLFFRIFG